MKPHHYLRVIEGSIQMLAVVGMLFCLYKFVTLI